jgi:hemerythrin-like metal-binding protein
MVPFRASAENGRKMLPWQPHYATGDEKVDAQHKALFEATDHFKQTLQAGQGEQTYDLFLEFLTVYAGTHFAFEEKCMIANECLAAERNKREHEHFMKHIAKENARFRSEGFTRESANAMLDMIERWLKSHICRIDIKLRDAIERKRGESSPTTGP